MDTNILTLFLNHYIIFFLGIILSVLLSFLASWIMNRVRNKEDWILDGKNKINKEDFERAFRVYKTTPSVIKILGLFEIVLYYFAIWLDYKIIIAWLTFKVASKWKTWSTIAKIPEKIEGKDNISELDFLEAKNKVATVTLQRWLLGNLLNIVMAFLSVLVVILLIRIFGKDPLLAIKK